MKYTVDLIKKEFDFNVEGGASAKIEIISTNFELANKIIDHLRKLDGIKGSSLKTIVTPIAGDY